MVCLDLLKVLKILPMNNNVEYKKTVKIIDSVVYASIYRIINESESECIAIDKFSALDSVSVFYSIYGDKAKILKKQFELANKWADGQIEVLKNNEILYIT